MYYGKANYTYLPSTNHFLLEIIAMKVCNCCRLFKTTVLTSFCAGIQTDCIPSTN